MLKKSLAALAIFVGFTSSAGAATCISEGNLKEQGPFASTYVHSIPRNDGIVVSIYLKDFGTEQNGFKETMLEVVRKDQCILAMNILSRAQVDERYQIYASWTELEEGAAGDNEGMPEEEVADVALSEDEQLRFLSPEGFAVPQIYDGPIGKPDFKKRDKEFADFRTRIRDAMSQGVNFSGKYALTQIGCGSSCSLAILSDLETGKQYDFIRGGEEVGPLSLKFSANSNLLISTWASDGKCYLESLLFSGEEWVSLSKLILGEGDLCYESVDDNISRYKNSQGLSQKPGSKVGAPMAK